jgi:hypothetical protein
MYTVNLKNDNLYLRQNGNVIQTLRMPEAKSVDIQGDEVQVQTDDNLYFYEIRSNSLQLVETQRL